MGDTKLKDMSKDEKIHYLSLMVKKLRKQSITDPLTKIYNKGYLIQRLKEEIERLERTKIPLSVAIFDIDDFKQYNDSYGHVEGDKVLKGVSKILYDNSRRIDICTRYGGEEFVVILPGTKKERAFAYLDRIRTEISELNFKKRVTISIGIAQFKDGMNVEILIDLADKRLYISKRTGKNKITIENH